MRCILYQLWKDTEFLLLLGPINTIQLSYVVVQLGVRKQLLTAQFVDAIRSPLLSLKAVFLYVNFIA